jgi:hypothetical protein
MRTRLTVLAAAGATVLAVVLASMAPASAFTRAVDALRASDVTATLSLRSSPRSLQALAALGEAHLAARDARRILSTSLTLSKDLGPGGRQRSQAIVHLGSNAPVVLRWVGDALYARANARLLLQTFGQDPSILGRITQISHVAGLEFVGPALAGRWMKFDGVGSVPGSVSSLGTARRPDHSLANLATALSSNARVTTLGQERMGTHLVVSVPLRGIYDQVISVARDLVASWPIRVDFPAASAVGSGELELNAWLRGGNFTQLDLDLKQFLELSGNAIPKALDSLALRLTMTPRAAPITAPSGAVAVNL